jgi:trehalose synthase
VEEVDLAPARLAALAEVLPAEQADRFEAATRQAGRALAGRTLWNINSTANGGGVAEILRSLLGYFLAAGARARWLVLDGDAEFYNTTKRLHNAIHGVMQPGGFGRAEHEHYQEVQDHNLPDILRLVGRDDLVMLNDPQTAGLVEPLRRAGVRVAWRCHIGRDKPNEHSVAAWEFLRRYVQTADAFVFSRREHAPEWVQPDRLWVIPPSIDPLSRKNRPIPPQECRRILSGAGLLAGNGTGGPALVQGGPPPDPAARLVVQVSRWDRLKDMAGVMAGCAMVGLPAGAHLLLVGPDVSGVTDDPEGAQVLAECLAAWQRLPAAVRERISLVSVSMDDPDENATIINAIQRHATVLVQKSLAEGFGLTVAEAMWKERPVVASAVGGIQDQIVDGRDGLLMSDPTDLAAFGRTVQRLLADQELRRRLGLAGHQRVREYFLDDRHLAQITDLVEAMLADRRPEPAAEHGRGLA